MCPAGVEKGQESVRDVPRKVADHETLQAMQKCCLLLTPMPGSFLLYSSMAQTYKCDKNQRICTY